MEPGPPYEDGEHLYENSMKLKVLNKLIEKLLSQGDKILIFSQMTRLLDILDDYLRFKKIKYCRIDGQTSAIDRETRIEDFQSEGSDKQVFLLSTRAGGLGIDLYAANIVILFDSDWNPHVDLQAIARAHRIGQKRDVKVFRFVTQGTIEEVIVKRAVKKLKLDNMIMQKDKSVKNNDKKVSKQEIMNAIHYGAQDILTSNEGTVEEEDIDRIINANNTNIDEDIPGMYYFEGEDYKQKQKLDIGGLGFIQTSRERKRGGIYDIDQYYREAFNVPVKDKKRLKGWRILANGGYDHQFFNNDRLDELDAKLIKHKEYQEEPDKFSKPPSEFNEKDEEEKQKLLSEGFSNWSKKEFFLYIKLCEMNGRANHDKILLELPNKTPQELQKYEKVFWKRYTEMENGEKYVERIERGEAEIDKWNQIEETIFDKFKNNKTKVKEFTIDKISIDSETGCKNKRNKKINRPADDYLFTKPEDQFLAYSLFKYGYNNWNLIKNEIRNSPRYMFNWRMQTNNNNDTLQSRSDMLIDMFKAEIDDSKTKTRAKSSKNIPRNKKHKTVKKNNISSSDSYEIYKTNKGKFSKTFIYVLDDVDMSVKASQPGQPLSKTRSTRNKNAKYT